MNKQNYQSILIPQKDNNLIPPSKQYCNIRKQSLQSLSDKYRNQMNFAKPSNFSTDSNPKLQYYMSKYKQQQQKIQKQRKKKQAYLRSNEFNTIFGDCIDQNRQKMRQQRNLERLRKQMQQKWVQHYEEPQHDDQHGYEDSDSGQTKTILVDYRQDPNKLKQLYLIDLELGRIKFQQQIQKKVINKHQMCNNEALLSKMSKNILSAYMVNFDQIFNAFIDDILQEQVLYLNTIEANYHINQKSKIDDQYEQKLSNNTNNLGYKQQFQTYKTLEMMELVKQLEDLCDDDHLYYMG